MPQAGARIIGPLPGARLVAIADEAARRATVEIGAVGASRVKESLLRDADSRGFIGRADTGLAHSLVVTSQPFKTPSGWATETGIGPPRSEIAAVLEEGRKPGRKPPPSDALIPWVERNLGNRIRSGMKGARVTIGSTVQRRAWGAVRAREIAHGRRDPGDFTGGAFRVWERKRKIAERHGGLRRDQGPKVTGVSSEAYEARVRSVAYLVARAIGRRGVPGLGMFAKAAAYLRAGKAAEILRSALHRTIAQSRPTGRR